MSLVLHVSKDIKDLPECKSFDMLKMMMSLLQYENLKYDIVINMDYVMYMSKGHMNPGCAFFIQDEYEILFNIYDLVTYIENKGMRQC